MVVRPRTITWLVIVALLTVLLVRLYLRKPLSSSARRPTPVPVTPGPRASATKPGASADGKDRSRTVAAQPVAPGELKLSDDAESKHGAFWLEQVLETDDVPAGTHLVDLYVALDPRTKTGVRVRLKNNEVSLEEGTAGKEGGLEARAITRAALPRPVAGATVLGVLWRGGEMSVWLGAKQVLVWQPKSPPLLPSGAPLTLAIPSATHVFANGLRLGARRTLATDAVRFDDTFMRETNSGVWRPFSGKWELTALAFPERSANPFSLRAAFGADEPVDDKLYQGRTREDDYGLGIVLSGLEGTLHVARITGGGPAARAGLAEDDIFLEVDGMSVEHLGPHNLLLMLVRGFGGQVRLKMLRPGERQVREFRITREHYRWGTPAEGTVIPPVNEPDLSGADQVALIAAGEAGWSDYAAEVCAKPLGPGGMGLAVGVTSPRDYLVFRWRGPAARRPRGIEMPLAKPGPETPPAADRLQLVRVAGGRETVLAECAAGYRPYEFYRLGVDWMGSTVTCFVDGSKVFAADVPDLKRGHIGLYALSGEPVFFDDVHVSSDRAALAATHHPEQAVNLIFASEQDMAAWGNPALEWDRDLKTGWALHKARFPGEQAVVLNKPRFSELRVQLACPDGPQPAATPCLTIAGGQAAVGGVAGMPQSSAQLGQGPFQRIAVRGDRSHIEADIDGTRISTRLAPGTEQAGSAFGDCIGIRGLKNLGDPSTVRVSSANTLEYSFDTSPADWKVACGRWGLLNKWICDPRWSWFGGRTKTLAALWNKCVFSGDICVEAYVSLMMQQEDPPYERPGDYNITICGDGVNLDSGYTLIFAGDNNSWTRLYRKGKLVAESTQEAHRIFSDKVRHPDKPDLHQRWFHVKLEKRGGTVSFYRDGAPAFSFSDPEPLTEGRVAFWTVDNGFLLSRVRIAHSGMKAGPLEPRRSGLFEDARVVNIFDGEVFTAVERQPLPPAIQAALAAPKDAFKPVDADPLPGPDAAATQAYRVVNGTGGGPFALQWKGMLVDPEFQGVLRFAYRIEPGANVDLYLLDVAGGRSFDPRRQGAYRWRMSGPAESDESAPLAGEVPGVQADGRWHAVQFDLNPSWRALWQQRGLGRPRRYLLRPIVGNLDNHGYLLAGMNGNHAGAAYSISDIQVLSPKDTDTVPPSVERVIWPYDADGDGRSVTLVFSDQGGGVMEESLQALLNDVNVPREATEFDHVRQRLRVDLLKLNLPALPSAPALKLRLLGFQDRARNSCGPYSTTYTYDSNAAFKAAKPVLPPQVAIEIPGGGDSVPDSAPLALPAIAPITPVARLEESSDAPPWAQPGQRRSIHIVNVNDGSAFGFALNNMSYNLRHWPYLLLEYKMPLETPVNLHFDDHTGATRALILGDTGDALDPLSQDIASRAGPPPDFICDGTWRRTLVPLAQMFGSDIPQPGVAALRAFSLYDNGWRGNRRAMQYWVHRIQPLPAARTGDYRFLWRAADLSGIADYASCLDQNPDTDPPGKQEIAPGDPLQAALARRGSRLNDGWNYLHVKVRNGAGVWSAPAHARFMLDNTPPRVVRTEPPDGGVCTGQTLKLFLDEEHGVESETVRLKLNGELIQGRHNIRYDPAANCLSYNSAAAGRPWATGAKVSVDVYGLRDLLGNEAVAPFSFNFTTDRGGDNKGPAVAQVRFSAPAYGGMFNNRQIEMETSFGLDFEEHTGHVRAMRDCRMEWLNDPAQACFGRRAVKLTALDDDADVQAMLHKNPWYVDRAPLLQFDYKADAGMRVDLLLEVMGQWLSIRFTGDGTAPEGGKAIGQVEAVMADGSWRHASVDLKSLLDAAWPDLPVRIVSKIILSAQGRDGCKRGAGLVLDNLELSRARCMGGRLEWAAAADPSGIRGYSFVLDQTATTIPPEEINEPRNLVSAGGRMGVWYAHIRACNQAGIWGPTRTIRIDYGQ